MDTRKPISPYVWKLCAAILLLGVAASVGLFFERRVVVSRIEERFVREAIELDAARFPRPTHVAPALSGTFGERAASHLETLIAAHGKLGELSHADELLLASVLRGAQPVAAAPSRMRSMLEKCRPALHGLLEATHAEAARQPDALAAPRPDPAAVAAVRLAARLLALEVAEEVAAGHAATALTRCLDGLALARDLSYGSALPGRMLATTVTYRLVTPCARAVDAAPSQAKREALRQLKLIRDATPSFATILAAEAASMTADTLGAALEPHTLQRLPSRFRSAAERSAAAVAEPSTSRHLVRASWPAIDRTWSAVVAALSLEKGAREREWASLRHQLAGSANPVAAMAAPNLDPSHSDSRDRLARTQLELLLHAAALDLRRAESGRWPMLLAELAPEVDAAAHPDAVREAALLYFVSEAEQSASLEGGESQLTQITLFADREVSP